MYSGTPADYAAFVVAVNDVDNNEVNVAGLPPNISLKVWTLHTGGTQLTDILDEGGTPLASGLVVTDVYGRIPLFQAPDGYYDDVWVEDPESLERWRIPPAGLSTRLAAVESNATGLVTLATAQTLSATKTWDLPDDDTKAWVATRNMTVTPTGSSDVANVYYKGSDDAHRAFTLNEWGGVRIRVPSVADLGYYDVGIKVFGRSGEDTCQFFASFDGSTPTARIREGNIWCRDITISSTGIIKDAAGLAVNGAAKAIKTTDQSVTSSTVLVDATDLTFTVVANTNYLMSGLLLVDTGATPDVKLGWVAPAGATMTWTIGGREVAASGYYTTTAAIGGTLSAGGIAASTIGALRPEGLLKVGGTGGTFKLQFAQDVSSATACILKADSLLRLERIA